MADLLEKRRSVRFRNDVHVKAADKDVLVRGWSHGLILMAKLAMAGGLPLYSYEGEEYGHGHLLPFLRIELWS